MNFEWVALGLGDLAWVALAFVLGVAARFVGLPPLVGFLASGFLLSTQSYTDHQLIEKLSDLGITLLLFTVGLKLNVRTLAQPQVWAVATIHMLVMVAVFGLGIYGLAFAGVQAIADLSLEAAFLIAFALSFSSTVFVVKVLEERGGMTSLQGRIAIGILLMQDIVAVVFLAVSSGKMPSLWAFSLFALVLMKPILFLLLKRIGHGELLVLYGFLLALGGAQVFELVGLKGDLGALVLGVLIASHPKAEEMSKAMLGFKDLFLLGFFLSVGLTAELSVETFAIAAVLTPFVLFKSALFFLLLTRFKLRARTSVLTSINLTNYSEFGLIVVAVGVANQWIGNEWLAVVAITLSLSFVVAALLNSGFQELYPRYQAALQRFQRADLILDDQPLDIGGATIAVLGMGGVGTGAYDALRSKYGDTVVGVDIDPLTASNHQAAGRTVFRGDPSDADFWDRVVASHTLKLVLLALPTQNTNVAVLNGLQHASFTGSVAATARFQDQVDELEQLGAITVFNMYTEAGIGFVAHVESELEGLHTS